MADVVVGAGTAVRGSPTFQPVVQLTIPGGSAVSQSLDCQGWRIGAIYTDGSFAGTALYLQASHDDQSWFDVYDRDGRLTWFDVGPNRSLAAPFDVVYTYNLVRFVSNTSQGAGTPTVLTVVLEPARR